MPRILKTNDLVKSIRRRAMIPESDATFSDEDLMDMANEEVQYFAIPHLISGFEDYLVNFVDIALSSTINEYVIPYRAVANKLRDVALIDTSGNLYEMSKINLDAISDFQNSFSTELTQHVFYIQNDRVILPNDITAVNGSLRLYYYLSPNQLVAENKVGVISAIDTVTGIVTLSNFPTAFSTLSKMDFVKATSPNIIHSYDKTPTLSDATTKTVTFATTDLPSELAVGDHLCRQQETMVLQLPSEFQAVIAQRVAVQALEAMGDMESLAGAGARLEKMETAILMLIQDRVEGAPQKINPRNGILRSAVQNIYGRDGRF
jgi:hypothetical protein